LRRYQNAATNVGRVNRAIDVRQAFISSDVQDNGWVEPNHLHTRRIVGGGAGSTLPFASVTNGLHIVASIDIVDFTRLSGRCYRTVTLSIAGVLNKVRLHHQRKSTARTTTELPHHDFSRSSEVSIIDTV
jgi:hypothetical protein